MRKKVEIPLDRLIEGVERLKDLGADDTGHTLYCSYLKFFRNLKKITSQDFLISASFVYAWMPTQLKLGIGDYEAAARIVQQAKDDESPLNEDQILFLKTTINSMVGTSKLLHFAAPDRYPIIDKWVCKCIDYGTPKHTPEGYLRYCDACWATVNDPQFYRLSEKITKEPKFKYFSPIRVLEYAMYLVGKNNNREQQRRG